MKKTLLFLGIVLCGFFAHAQTVLTEASHGLLPGNPNPMILTKFETPGVAGAQVTWDFSGLPQVSPFRGDVVEAGTANPPVDLLSANSCLIEGALHAYMKTTEESLRVLGLRIGEDAFVRVYKQPVLKMRYPFAYGDTFAGESEGEDRHAHGSYPIVLCYKVEADGLGTLILPGTTLKNVLRVATTHTLRYQNSKYANTAVTYRWYVKSHRYPVLSLIFEKQEDGTLKPIKGAYNPIVELPETQVVADAAEANGKLHRISTRPNPFNEQLTVAYTLGGQSNVTIALYNMQGALVRTLLQTQQPAGEYEQTFTHEVQPLTPGQYIIRVEAAGNTLVQRVIKVH